MSIPNSGCSRPLGRMYSQDHESGGSVLKIRPESCGEGRLNRARLWEYIIMFLAEVSHDLKCF